MSRLIKRTILFLSISIIFIISALISIGYIYSDEIIQLIVNQANKNLNTTIQVEKATFSIIRNFPYASVSFYNVKIAYSKDFILPKADTTDKKWLLEVENVTIKFNTTSLITNNYIIKGLVIKNGYCNLLINKFDQSNYNVLRKDTSQNSQINTSIDNILLKNIEINYSNYKEKQSFSALLSVLRSKGNILENNSIIVLSSNIEKTKIQSVGNNFEFNNKTVVKAEFKKNPEKIDLHKISLENELINLSIDGIIINNNQKSFTVNYSAEINDLKHLEAFYKKSIPDSLSINRANLSVTGNISGNFIKALNFNYLIKADLKDCQINYKAFPLKNISSSLEIKGLSNDFSRIDIDLKSLQGEIFKSQYKLKGVITKNHKQFIKLEGDINLNISDLNYIEPLNKIIDFENGESKINFKYNSKLTDSTTNLFDLKNVEANISIDNCDGKIIKDKIFFEVSSKSIDLKDNNLIINNLYGKYNDIPFDFEGNINNIDKLNTSFETTGRLHSSSFDLAKLLNSFSAGSDSITINANLLLVIDSLNYNKIRASKIRSQLLVSNNNLKFNNLSGSLCKGQVINGKVEIQFNNNSSVLRNEITTNKIDINQLFKMFDNFGQDILTQKNINGLLGGKFACQMSWSNNTFNANALKGSADFEIEKGELNGFEPLFKLSKFIEVEELNSVKFSNLRNRISIENQEISIPQMEIKTSALNLSLSGRHTLDNTYEYHFKVLLSDILYKKFIKKKQDTEFGTIEKDTTGRTNLFIVLKGNGTEYKIDYDRKQAFNSFSNQLKSEKQTIKTIFKEEFGFFKSDTTAYKNSNSVQKRPKIESDEISPKEMNNKKESPNVKKKPKQEIEWKDE